MEKGSPSRRSWADEAAEELPSPRSLGAGSPHLLSDVAVPLGSPAVSLGERISFSDSESYSDSEPPSPPPPGRGKAVAGPAGRRRGRRNRRRRQRSSGFMAAARRAHLAMVTSKPTTPQRLPSSTAHPARALAEPDADGFYEVRSRRRWRRRSPPKPSRPVPAELQGLCFNCLACTHVRRECTFPSRCYNCFLEGHHASACHLPPRRGGFRRGRSPSQRGPGRRADARRRIPRCRRAGSAGKQPTPPPPPLADSAPPLPPVESPPPRAGGTPGGSSGQHRRFELVVIPRSAELQHAEDALGLALVATVGGTRPPVSPDMVSHFLLERFGIPQLDAVVSRHDPEDFVVRFRRSADRNRVLAAPPGGALLPLLWRPWLRTAMATTGSFRFSALVGLTRVPLHARSASTAQTILGRLCANVEVVRPTGVPDDDGREFFVSCCCLHPRLIPEEKLIFIPEPHVADPVEGDLRELRGLRYLARIRVIAFHDRSLPPPAPDYDYGDGDSPDCNIDRYHPGLDRQPPASPADSHGNDGPCGGSHLHHRHLELELAGAAGHFPADVAGLAMVVRPSTVGRTMTLRHARQLSSLVVGSIPCPLASDQQLPGGTRGDVGVARGGEIPDVTSTADPATSGATAHAERALTTFSDGCLLQTAPKSTPHAAPLPLRVDPMELEAELGMWFPARSCQAPPADWRSPDLGPRRSGPRGARTVRDIIDASPGARGEKVLLRPTLGIECELDLALGRDAVVSPVRRMIDLAQLELPVRAPSPSRPHQASPPGNSTAPGSPHAVSPAGNGPLQVTSSFADSLRLPLDAPILQTPPPTASFHNDDWVPRRSIRLAGKAPFRDPDPERQAKRVLISKWSSTAPAPRTDASVDAKFREAFALPLSPSKRSAMNHFYPARGGRGRRGSQCSHPAVSGL